jgi:hypothetical protein
MSMSDFQDRFVANKGQPIDHEGQQINLSVRVPVEAGDELRIRLVQAVSNPIQGLKLRAENAEMTSVRDVGNLFVIWDDTAPAETVVRIQKAKAGASVILRNVWKDGAAGAMMQGLRFAGMIHEVDRTGALVLRCSDGRGEADFDDLIAVVTHVKQS